MHWISKLQEIISKIISSPEMLGFLGEERKCSVVHCVSSPESKEPERCEEKLPMCVWCMCLRNIFHIYLGM